MRGRMIGLKSQGGHEDGSSYSSLTLSIWLHTKATISLDQYGKHVDSALKYIFFTLEYLLFSYLFIYNTFL